jgi:hypothetical protein
MQTGSSETLIGWKSGQTLHGTEWRERGYGHRSCRTASVNGQVCILFIEEKPAPVMALVQRWNHHVEQREEIRRKFSVKIARKHRNGHLNTPDDTLLYFVI